LPQYSTRFRWRENSIAFWDNRAAQHIAVWDYYPAVRTGYRVQIKNSVVPRA
jgi:taurine dioxygenase